MFTITITEVDNHTDTASNIIRYQQTVDVVDLRKIINAVNDAAQPPRQRAPRSDAGKPRAARVLDESLPKKASDDEFFK